MSIQFRTRSQTVVDYSQYITNNNITGCCYVYNSNTNSVSKIADTTVSDCNQRSGHFIAGQCDENTNITPSSVGCCCACSFSTSANFLQKTTLCECQSVSGLWTLDSDCTLPTGPGSADASNAEIKRLCISGTLENSNQLDYRNKRACCHPEYNDDGTVYANCTDVCSEKECAEKAVYPYTSTFYNSGRKCNEQVGNAGPAADECKLSETNTRVLNSCENGTNVFCWNIPYMSTCDSKTWFDNKFAGRFAQGINQGVFEIRIKDNPEFYDLILAPKYASTYSDPIYAESETSTTVIKFCPGGYAEGRENSTDGYFAIINEQYKPIYYFTQYFRDLYAQTPLNCPIPSSLPSNIRVLDLIATRHFSAYINNDNTVKIYGRFYDGKNNQFKTLTVNTKLKKLYQHNVYEYNGDTASSSITSIGFVGQKLDNSFDYYSPFINDLDELKTLRDNIRSLPRKEFVKASLGSNTFCGIDADGIMTCNSLNTELTYPLNRKYRLVSCSSDGGFQGNTDPDFDYCFAVDENNRVIKMGLPNTEFEKQPQVSYTDILDLSCYAGACFAVVEPDMNICNSQMNGSCCQCVDVDPCIQTNQGNCTRLGGKFKTGGLCCNRDNPIEGCVDCNTVVDADCGTSTFVQKITQAETTLPDSELTYYEDGLYVGIFEPGVPINTQGSVVNGNPYTGSAVEYIPNVVGYGTTAKRWAIIVDTNDYDLSTINDKFEPTEVIPPSMYDGLWNTYGDNQTYYGIQSKTMETLRENSKLSGWYLPSKNELEFINSKLNHGFFIPEVFKSMNSGIYLTSTPYFERQSVTTYNLDSQIFKGQSFMFGQSYSKSDYGSIYLVPRTSQVNVRRIRRIELE
jgi:hypothetical protein